MEIIQHRKKRNNVHTISNLKNKEPPNTGCADNATTHASYINISISSGSSAQKRTEKGPLSRFWGRFVTKIYPLVADVIL